ncbi:hypothetical protein Patl1_05038 [Pistacia atlantica]|uniref:Uncharacterized protein n=1 Tax=Pistacia atlantica TaxID=434234 RepID=A0ACC1BWS0_9ROSI|nr:hypothetical protein Patl1_05038 [Pistacia atlantica]
MRLCLILLHAYHLFFVIKSVTKLVGLCDDRRRSWKKRMKPLSDHYSKLKPKEIVRRISDEDLDDDGDLLQLASESSEKSNNNLKKRKVSEEIPSKPTDSLTKDSVDSSSNRETPTDSGSQGDSKLPRKTPLVRISVIRKPTEASDTKVAAKSESKQLESTGLLSLCQNYDSDDE